jgi:hypothetical protein
MAKGARGISTRGLVLEVSWRVLRIQLRKFGKTTTYLGHSPVQFDGPRYRADLEEQYVTWMGWSFYLGFEHDMGLNLWDITFRGERIIYEISPQVWAFPLLP